MNYYQQMMTEATGVTDAATINEIEEIMRMEAGTLDGLTAAAFKRLAKRAYAAVNELQKG